LKEQDFFVLDPWKLTPEHLISNASKIRGGI